MADLAEQLRQRIGPLIEPERKRLTSKGGMDCDHPTRYQPWEVVRVAQGFDEDEEGLRRWVHEGIPDEVRPILCGYDKLLASLERDEVDAIARARHILSHELSYACGALSQYWMERLLSTGRHGGDRPGEHRPA